MTADRLPPAEPETLAAATVFTVTVAGPERHDGEAGYTYVVHADNEHDARALVLAYHAASHDLRAVEIGIDTDHGPLWRFGYDPAIRPDVVFIPDQSFPGAPDWPEDSAGRAWRDMRPAAEQARILTALAAENERLRVARDFGLDVADIDTGPSAAPAVPPGDAVLHLMQLRARRALSPGRLPTQGAETIAFILGMAHIRALTTAICDRDLANGVEPDQVGQILIDANYTAVNQHAGTDEDPPPYFHHRLDVDHWALLKAADCYRFQIQAVGNDAAAAANNAVGKLRAELIAALGVDQDDYRMRFEWDAADGWPLLEAVPAPIRRAEALIEHYQTFEDIEELSPPDFGQHISDMIADLLHYAHDEDLGPFGLLDSGLTHFHAETRKPDLRPEPDKTEAPVLRLLVATDAGQGQRAYDFCHALPGEILYPPSECPHCHDPADERRCHLLYGTDTGRATTTFAVANVPISVADLHLLLAKAWGLAETDIEASDIPATASQMIAVASRFPLRAVLGKTARRYRRRHTRATPPDPPAAGPEAPDAEEELKPWTVRVRLRREHAFTVEAHDEDSAMDAAWDTFDEDRNIVDQDCDVHVSLAA